MSNQMNRLLPRLGYIATAAVMLTPCIILMLSREIAWVCFLISCVLLSKALLIIPVLLILNIAAFIRVAGDGFVSGILLTLFGGFIGGFIAANTVNKSYPLRIAVNCIFIAGLFIMIYPVFSICLFQFEFHSMLM